MRILFAFNTPVLKHGSFEEFMITMGDAICCNSGTVTYAFPGIAMDIIHSRLKNFGNVYIIRDKWPGTGFAANMREIVRIERPNLVNVHFCNTIGYLSLGIWLRAKGIKLVFHYHGEILPLSEVAKIKRYIPELRCVTLPANLVVTVSKANTIYL
jgi:hypothetical protein